MVGFIPSQNGTISDQPTVVKDFIRFFFIGIPVLLAFISFIFKMKYPIDSEQKMIVLKSSIKIQNEKSIELQERVDYYKIQNPIYNKNHIQIFCKTQNQMNSKILADHFYNIEYLKLIQKGDYELVRTKLIGILLFLLSIALFSTITLIFTFKYLEIKSLSLIPLISLFIITISVSFLIINFMRLRIITRVIANEYHIDNNFMFTNSFINIIV